MWLKTDQAQGKRDKGGTLLFCPVSINNCCLYSVILSKSMQKSF